MRSDFNRAETCSHSQLPLEKPQRRGAKERWGAVCVCVCGWIFGWIVTCEDYDQDLINEKLMLRVKCYNWVGLYPRLLLCVFVCVCTPTHRPIDFIDHIDRCFISRISHISCMDSWHSLTNFSAFRMAHMLIRRLLLPLVHMLKYAWADAEL